MGEVRIPGQETAGKVGPWVHKINGLTPEMAFPFLENTKDGSSTEKDITGEYGDLWEKFVVAWDRNKVDEPWAFINRTLGILEHFTWCIPSAVNVFPDISLFDHLKTTAAIAACLAEPELPAEPFILAATDFGGIQNYIYSIRMGAGGLARRLRARSFNVAMLGDTVVHRILRNLDLPMTNCLISSGGRSYLLLPNSLKAKEAMNNTRLEIDTWSIRETLGEIRMNLAFVPLTKEDLGDFSASLQKVNAALREEKEKPLSSCLQGAGKWVDFRETLKHFEIPEKGGLCDSCQKNGGPLRPVRDKMVPICDQCNVDQELGKILPLSKYIAFYDDDQGRFYLPFGTFELTEDPSKLRSDPYMVLSMGGFSDVSEKTPLAFGFRVRYIPRDDRGELLTFEEIADKAQGRKALAYLKSDVDSLGFIFGYGFRRDKETDRTSISRITTLSRFLDLFFSGYFETLLTTEFPDVYTVYSGGDDLVCLGPWDRVVGLALRVREKFREYSCQNPAWTMSSGIALVGSRTPVLTAVEQSDRMLDVSKETRGMEILPFDHRSEGGNRAKDRITSFGTSIPWAKYPDLLTRGLWLTRLVKDGKLNTSKVRRLLRYGEMFREFQRSGDTRHLRYIYLLTYDLRRNWGTGESDDDERKALEWAQRLLIPGDGEMAGLRFVCEYALNAVREKEA
jgi:CRISPR-associated protein Csm1